MEMTSFVHVSDLHIGVSAAADRNAVRLCEALQRESGPVLLTGDITHRGLPQELARFNEIFEPLLRTGRLISVPGNHDRLGADLRDDFMPGPRIQTEQRGDLWIVRLDSTGLHNRRWLEGHGKVSEQDIDDVEAALRAAPAGMQTALMVHHHPLPLAHDHPMELLVTMLGWPNARELSSGLMLLQRIRGLCDVVLHGHRHVPAELSPWPADERQLRLFSAGSSTLQRCYRTFRSATGMACWKPLDEANEAPSIRRHNAEISRDVAGAALG
jgi:Icc protein